MTLIQKASSWSVFLLCHVLLLVVLQSCINFSQGRLVCCSVYLVMFFYCTYLNLLINQCHLLLHCCCFQFLLGFIALFYIFSFYCHILFFVIIYDLFCGYLNVFLGLEYLYVVFLDFPLFLKC